MRRRHRVLLDPTGEPEGGQWNFDHDNRGSFSREGPAAEAAEEPEPERGHHVRQAKEVT